MTENMKNQKNPNLPEMGDGQITESGTKELKIEPEIVGKNPLVKKMPKHKRNWVWIGVLFIIISIILGTFFGYRNGIARRLAKSDSTRMERVSQNLELAYQDIAANRLENAKIRLEYIQTLYPNFPGINDLLYDVTSRIANPTPTPTPFIEPTQTPVFTPTPDTRGAEELFNQIKLLIEAQQWEAALENITSIRENYYHHRTLDIDGYYFIALRNDGLYKIYNGKLEQGLFELSQAEQLGALDRDAENARYVASTYLTGASFWDTNWPEVIRIFENLANTYPSLMDSSGMTSVERLRQAYFRFAETFSLAGNYCTAEAYYLKSLSIGNDPQVQQLADMNGELCRASQVTPEPEFTPTPDAETTPGSEPSPDPGVTPTP